MRKKIRPYDYVNYPKVNHVPLNSGYKPAESTHKTSALAYARITVVLAGALILGVTALPSRDNPGETLSVTQTQAAEDMTKKVPEIDTTVMSEQINAIIAEHPELDISVAVYDIKGEKQHVYGVDAAYVAASVSKLLTATYLLHSTEEGTVNISEVLQGVPLSTHLQRLIVNSDNDSWRALNDKLVRANLMNYASDAGLEHYSSVDNTVRTKDVALLLKKIYAGELLNAENTQLLLGHMEKANRNQYIAKGIPQGTKFYHKAGWLDDRIHDVAIVEHPDRPFTIAIFSKSRNTAYPPAALNIFGRITQATANTYIIPKPPDPAQQVTRN